MGSLGGVGRGRGQRNERITISEEDMTQRARAGEDNSLKGDTKHRPQLLQAMQCNQGLTLYVFLPGTDVL